MSSKIKVLHFIAQVNQNDFVDSIVSNIDKDRFEMHVCVLHFPIQFQFPDYEVKGIRYYILNSVERIRYPLAIAKLLRIVKKNKIDIVHAHLFDESFLMAIVKLLCPKVKFVVGRHYSDEIYLTSSGLKRSKSLWIESFTNRMADIIVSPSSFISTLMEKQKVKLSKIIRIPYGFDFESVKYKRNTLEEINVTRLSLGIDKHKFIVANIGRHYFLKGQEFLLEGFQAFSHQYPDSLLLMIGDGPYHQFLKNKAEKLQLGERVLFTGWRKDTKNLISLADVIIQPTQTEAFPQIMIETMALKTPLIITPVSGAGDQVTDKKTGILIEPRNAKSIENSLEWIYNHRDEAKIIAENGYKHIHDNLTIKTVIKNYEKLYNQLMKK